MSWGTIGWASKETIKEMKKILDGKTVLVKVRNHSERQERVVEFFDMDYNLIYSLYENGDEYD